VVSGDGRRLFVLIPKSKKEAGVSLVELLVVMVIIAIVMTMAILSRGDANEIFQRKNAIGELKVAFERARFDSVKRRADGAEPYPYSSVEVRSTGFTLRTYTREGNAATATEHSQVQTFPNGVTLNHISSGVLPMTISFNRRGEVVTGSPQFRITDAKSGGSETILVSATGTVNVISGGATPTPFPAPALSALPIPGPSIDQHVVIPTPTP
jgi:prepilin-type N-terminal cleavage/methylation domain-containing protein